MGEVENLYVIRKRGVHWNCSHPRLDAGSQTVQGKDTPGIYNLIRYYAYDKFKN